jgi:hypothetical protein
MLLYKHCWYIPLADMMHFQLHNDDDVTTTNENYYFLCSCLHHLMMIKHITFCTLPLLSIAACHPPSTATQWIRRLNIINHFKHLQHCSVQYPKHWQDFMLVFYSIWSISLSNIFGEASHPAVCITRTFPLSTHCEACMFQNSQTGSSLLTTISQVTSVPEHFEALPYIKILCQSFAFNPHCCDPTTWAK